MTYKGQGKKKKKKEERRGGGGGKGERDIRRPNRQVEWEEMVG